MAPYEESYVLHDFVLRQLDRLPRASPINGVSSSHLLSTTLFIPSHTMLISYSLWYDYSSLTCIRVQRIIDIVVELEDMEITTTLPALPSVGPY
jgi:hypothetical protein